MKTALLTSGSISGNLRVSAVLWLESKQPVLRYRYKWRMISDSSSFELQKQNDSTADTIADINIDVRNVLSAVVVRCTDRFEGKECDLKT